MKHRMLLKRWQEVQPKLQSPCRFSGCSSGLLVMGTMVVALFLLFFFNWCSLTRLGGISFINQVLFLGLRRFVGAGLSSGRAFAAWASTSTGASAMADGRLRRLRRGFRSEGACGLRGRRFLEAAPPVRPALADRRSWPDIRESAPASKSPEGTFLGAGGRRRQRKLAVAGGNFRAAPASLPRGRRAQKLAPRGESGWRGGAA